MFSTNQNQRLAGLGWALHGAGLALMVSMALVTYWYVVSAVAEESQQLQSEGDAFRAVLAQRSDLVAEKLRIEKMLKDRQERLQAVLARIPADASESNFLAQISELSRASGLAIRQFRPGGINRYAEYSVVQVEVNGAGDFEAICRFLHGLPQLTRLSEVTTLEIHSSEADAGVYPISITMEIFYAPLQQTGESISETAHAPNGPTKS